MIINYRDLIVWQKSMKLVSTNSFIDEIEKILNNLINKIEK